MSRESTPYTSDLFRVVSTCPSTSRSLNLPASPRHEPEMISRTSRRGRARARAGAQKLVPMSDVRIRSPRTFEQHTSRQARQREEI